MNIFVYCPHTGGLVNPNAMRDEPTRRRRQSIASGTASPLLNLIVTIQVLPSPDIFL
ncbi:hypothetical protein [Mesorhizobium sp. LjRoot246]|uniref:hypothetical protein n=1 Tax=Mesorhizobium sp. LjRoot246 TaxID=3342294 RepID=UPI003ED153C8